MSDAITTESKGSWVQQFFEKARGNISKAPAATPASYVRETGSTIGDYAEGGITGSLLGAAHAKWGLDTKAGPIDGMIAGIGALASIGISGHMPLLATHVRKVGLAAATVFSFRRGYEVVKHEPLAGMTGVKVSRPSPVGKGPGVAREDPIEKVARDLA